MPIKIVTVSKGNSAGASLLASEWIDKVLLRMAACMHGLRNWRLMQRS